MIAVLQVIGVWLLLSAAGAAALCLLIRGGRRAEGRPVGRQRLRLPAEEARGG